MDLFIVEARSTFGRLRAGALFVPFSRSGRPDLVDPDKVLSKMVKSTEAQADPERPQAEVYHYAGGRAKYNPAPTTKVWKVVCKFSGAKRTHEKN